jgi:two-component system OmpR family sensor kinase
MSEPAASSSWSLERWLQWRLIGTVIGFWLVGSTGTLFGVWHETGKVLDSALREVAERLMVLPDVALADERSEQLFAALAAHQEFVIYQVFDAQGQMRMRSHAAPVQPLDASGATGVRDVGSWRVFTLTGDGQGRRVQVAESVEHRREVLWSGLGWLVAALGVTLPVMAFALHWLLRIAFRGLEPARRQLAARAAQDLQPVVNVDLPRELQPWIGTINELIRKVRDLIEAERIFAAQTAHEVRTPLAAARAQAQRLTITATDEATRTRAHALLRQLDRLARLVTRLLQLARIESGVPLRRERVDLVALAQLVAGEFADAQASGRLRVQVQGEPAAIAGDLDMLGIAIRNLIDNALKYAGANAQVTVIVAPAMLSVEDNGPGVAPELLTHLVRPFERARAVTEGSGLGLAIVDQIVRQSGAALQLRSPLESGPGFSASIRFDPDHMFE